MLRFEWLLCCHRPVCIYFMFAILRLNKPHFQPWGNAEKRRGWNNRGCGRGSHTCSRALFVSCCTSGATNHRSNLAWIWHQCFFAFQTDVNLTIVHSNPLHYHQVTFFTDLSLQMLLFHWKAETCRVEAAPSAILEQAGRLVSSKIFCEVSIFSRKMKLNVLYNCTSFVLCILASGGWI